MKEVVALVDAFDAAQPRKGRGASRKGLQHEACHAACDRLGGTPRASFTAPPTPV